MAVSCRLGRRGHVQVALAWTRSSRPVSTTWAMNDATLAQYYNTSFNGLPGNDERDGGIRRVDASRVFQDSYPVGGQDTYLLSRPYFPKITIRNEATGAVATIIASGLSDQNKYIQSATGRAVVHEELAIA
ncbi:hypothetical protein B0H14DRAFT_3653003 [Mycena olivaceomarginata]|nr:hypothetical protein B0H14DRAFT_3653003 [Mycena olivaceomarginata]